METSLVVFEGRGRTPIVMRGLDPRIHPFQKRTDCRVKPGNDELSAATRFVIF
jgi:hypothetical protein